MLFNLICFTGIYAQQVKSTMSLLTQNEWTTIHNLGGNDSIVSVARFTQTGYAEKSNYQESQIGFTAKYYLSDKLETTFNHDKVGKVSDGRYIITLNNETVIIYEIINISDTEFEYAVVNPNEQTRSSKDQKIFTARVKPK